MTHIEYLLDRKLKTSASYPLDRPEVDMLCTRYFWQKENSASSGSMISNVAAQREINVPVTSYALLMRMLTFSKKLANIAVLG